MTHRILRRHLRLALLALLPAALAGCLGDDNNLLPGDDRTRVEVIVNSTSNTLSLVSIDSALATPRTVSLGAQGSPVSVAARGAYAVVPLGTYPFAAIVDLRTATVARNVALPANSGATGVAFMNDSIALVGNPNRNSVTPINVRTGTAGAEIQVGVYPQALVSGNNGVYVLNANLVNFSPAGPGSVTVINQSLQVVTTIPLTGINPSAGRIVSNTLLVVNSGNFGQANGTLSLVNVVTSQQAVNVPGFGEFPGTVDVGPDGMVYVGVYGTGILVWNPNLGVFQRGLSNPIVPGDGPPISALRFDDIGRLHTLAPGDCAPGHPGKEYGLASPFTQVTRTITTGVCPFALAFALVPAS